MGNIAIVDPQAAIQEEWGKLLTFFSTELIDLIHKNAVIGSDDNEKTYYVAHQILAGRDVSKLLMAEVCRLLAVGVQS